VTSRPGVFTRRRLIDYENYLLFTKICVLILFTGFVMLLLRHGWLSLLACVLAVLVISVLYGRMRRG
jgi:hypothetical protein